MKKLTQPQAATLLTALVVAAGLVVWVTHIHFHHPPPVAPPGERGVTTTTTSNPPVVTTPTPTTPTNPVTTTQTSTPTATDIARLKSLNDRSMNFLRAYYELLPRDTSTSRHRRLAPYAVPAFFHRVKLKITDRGTPAGKARVSSHLEVAGNPVASQLVIKSLNGDHSLMQVSIPVNVITKTPTGSVVNSSQQQTTSRWSYNGHNWLITAFHEGGEGGG